MNQPHKHKDTIIAWANGAQIQYQTSLMKENNEWEDIWEPSWVEDVQYRVKPDPKESVHTYRIGVGAYGDGSVYTFTVDTEEEETAFQSEPTFIGWLSDWEAFLLVKEEE